MKKMISIVCLLAIAVSFCLGGCAPKLKTTESGFAYYEAYMRTPRHENLKPEEVDSLVAAMNDDSMILDARTSETGRALIEIVKAQSVCELYISTEDGRYWNVTIGKDGSSFSFVKEVFKDHVTPQGEKKDSRIRTSLVSK